MTKERARELLGDGAVSLSDEELEDFINDARRRVTIIINKVEEGDKVEPK